ncbi:hypothetical protein CRG98_021019 [Punica granatum]|uniref:XRCC4 N-terminal domain-containing protein n=1 Tax=Punica granatum TaxID=22663 RepID=A0A2I0JSV6_PUNGR|nr:hypothetical protein CRG98_021019 [Punica granatum]
MEIGQKGRREEKERRKEGIPLSPSERTFTEFRPFAVSRLGFTASEEEVRERAAQWDQPEADYIELAERYLGFQQPGSVYKFTDAENRKKLSEKLNHLRG